MAELARVHGFRVTVAVAPCAVRLYAPYVDTLRPELEGPHLIDQLLAASRRHGFITIDLLQELRPYADRELLHFRDDDHWNERGHEVVAEIVARRLL